jgi:hypothetical protein
VNHKFVITQYLYFIHICNLFRIILRYDVYKLRTREIRGWPVIILSRILCLSVVPKNVNIKTTVPLVLYGCETWCLMLRKEHRLRTFEEKVTRKVFGPVRKKETG